MKIFIKDAKFEIAGGYVGCGGAYGGSVISVIKFKKDDDKYQWFSLVDYEGYPLFYLSSKDIFKKLVELESLELSDDAFDLQDKLDSYRLYKYGDIDLYKDNFKDILESIDESNLEQKLLKLSIAINRLSIEETELLIKNSKNKSIEEIDIPDVE